MCSDMALGGARAPVLNCCRGMTVWVIGEGEYTEPSQDKVVAQFIPLFWPDICRGQQNVLSPAPSFPCRAERVIH